LVEVEVENGEIYVEEEFEEEDTGERRWQAAVAGAVGSLGLLWEEKGRRVGVAQQYVGFFFFNSVRNCTHNVFPHNTH
jgi:hypothetical protein